MSTRKQTPTCSCLLHLPPDFPPPLFTFVVFPYPLAMQKPVRELSLMLATHRVRPSGRLWNPSADVYRSDEGWVVKVDLAGVSTDDLEIEIRDATLCVRGSRRDTLFKEGFIYHQMEITYSRFEKTIQFPDQIEGASVAHDYQDGFLIINVRSGSGD